MPPRKSKDKEVQPAQADHADDSPLHFEGENDPITFLPVSPLAERSYGNPVFKEKEADRGGDFAESSNMFRGMMERLDLAFKEKNQTMQRLVKSQAESSKSQEEIIKQCMEDMRRVFEEGTRVMRETGEESRRTLQAVSEQVVEQVRQPRPEIPPPVVEMPKQIQEAPIPALGGQGNQPHPNIQQQNFFMGEGQRQHEPMKAAAPIANHGHQPQHRPALRPLVRPAYRKPYPDIIDHENPFPRGFKVPEFTLFSGEVGQSTIEHIGRFTIQCGEASGDDNLKLRLFPSSLTGTALTWYLSLPQNSVYSWRQMEDLFHTQFYRCEPEVSMADLSRLGQKPGESSEAFLARFRRARLKYRVALPEQEFVKLAQNGLDIELRKKFERMEFRDFYELSYKVARYENLLKEDVQKKAASHGTYYSDPNFDLDVAEVVTDKPVVCPDLVKPTHQPETSVRRYVGEAGKQYTFDVSKASDIFDVLKKSGLIKLPPGHKIPTAVEIRARDYCKFHNSWKHSTDNCLIFRNVSQEKIDKGILKFPDKAKETMGVDADPFPTVDLDIEGASGQTSRGSGGKKGSLSPSRRWEKISHPKFLAQNPRTLRRKLQRKRAEERKRHQKQVEAEGSSSRRPRQLTKRNMVWVRKEKKKAVTQTLQKEDDQSSASPKVASVIVSLDGVLKATFEAQEQSRNGGAESKEDGTIHFGEFSVNLSCLEKEKAVLEITKKLAAYFAEKAVQVDRSEIVHEGEEVDRGDEITLEELDLAPAKLDDLKAEVQDPLEEINLGSESEPKVTFISGSLEPQTRDQIVRLLHEFKDCFAWDYSEMPEVTLKVKEEIERLIKAGFIRTCKYADWLSNVVPVLKKNGKLRVCVDFLNLNLATPKDEYPMPIVDLLIDGVARHKILSFMDGHSGYNQIFIADVDVPKTAFRCPSAIGTFEWVVMPFGLKNAGATYQRAMNAIFHDMIGKFMEIYIDDVVVKSNGEANHLVYLRKSFERMRQHGLKMNPLKCAFGVSAGNFLGYLVHERGLEVDKNKARAVIEAKPPQNKKELQRFLGQVNFLRCFISNLAGKTRVFSPLLKLKSEADFKWEEHHQSAFDMIKWYLSRPPVLVPPVKNKPLILYISTADEFIGCLLAQENDKKQEQAVYYLSRCLTQTEVYVVAKTDIVKYMLSRPLLRGRIGKWILALSEFNLKYIPQRAIKRQALADFLADYLCLDMEADEEKGINLFSISLVPWKLIFDGSSTETMSGAGVVVISPSGLKTQMSFQLDFNCTNNQAEYEALIIGLEMLVELKVSMVEIVLLMLRAANLVRSMGHFKLQRVPASELNSIMKPWPFRGWAIDLIGKVYPPSSKGHSFIIVATDYFTKWVEAKPMKKVDQSDVIQFIKEDIIHRFGLPETITTDQGTVFVSHQVEAFAKEMGFRLLNSTHHYAQANGQAEASNKVVINLLEKMVDDNPRRWHALLSETLWAYRTSQRSSTKMTPFALTYGHNAVLPMELIARSLRVVIQHNLQSGEYDEAMMLELEDLEDSRLTALDRLQAQKLKIAKSYNKRVKGKNLAVGDLVWKAILPLGKKDHRFRKWSPNWEGHFEFMKC
ncbi:hypothetical protein SLEP1_g42743 [Rubroshorea leprosula]|uniref:Integrase catalytic domain-containing protein n=1 Tax=Rubroshorea leprosula TaxID=152421 RepID=A0AAV5LAU0_9ROSI|nr:hypothetical protein SLEP1_g42743 [Rubroshorea leprosula]